MKEWQQSIKGMWTFIVSGDSISFSAFDHIRLNSFIRNPVIMKTFGIDNESIAST